MNFEIKAQEFNLAADGFEIRTQCPQKELTEEKILQRVRANNLHPCDTIKVFCMDHGYTTVHAMCEYVVTHKSQQMRQHQLNDRDIKQVNETHYEIAMIRDWWIAGEPTMEVPKGTKPKMRWNPGKQKHEVVQDGEVVFEGAKDEAKSFVEDAA